MEKSCSKLFAAALLGALLFASCDNVSSGGGSTFFPVVAVPTSTPGAGNSPSSASSAKTIVIQGTLEVQGAVPSQFVSQSQNSELAAISKSASPKAPFSVGSGDYYFVTADPINGNTEPAKTIDSVNNPTNFTDGSNGKAFTLPLKEGSWKITAGIKNSANKIILSGWCEKTLSVTDSVFTHAFTAVPSTSGKGEIALDLSYEGTDVTSVTATCDALSSAPIPLTQTSATSSKLEFTGDNSVKSGAYEVVFSFYAGDVLIYTSVQTINVLDNMTTNAWVSYGGTDDDVISASSFVLTDSVIKAAALTCFFVGTTSVGEASDTTGEGTAYAPFETVGKAAAVIAKAGVNTKSYTIYISGAVAGQSELPKTLNGKAKSITVQGATGNASDSLCGSASSRAVKIQTSVPIIFRNIKITGGKALGDDAAGRGGGIYACGGDATLGETFESDITLDAGSVVEGNSAKCGGGVYMTKSTLLVKNGATINGNTAEIKGGNFHLYDNAKLDIKGGEISGGVAGKDGNDAYGGAISAEGEALSTKPVITMTGGKISSNKCLGYGSKTAIGGAVWLGSFSEFKMTGGSIENNCVQKASGSPNLKGGAVYIEAVGAGEFLQTLVYGELKLGGSAKIPYDKTKGQGNNDVFVSEWGMLGNANIEITSAFDSGAGKVAAVTPSGWARGKSILKVASGDISPYIKSFETTDPDFDFIKSTVSGQDNYAVLTAPLYVSTDRGSDGSGTGTREKPYQSLNKALMQMNGGQKFIVYILDELRGPQKIESSFTYNETPFTFDATKCSELTLKGATGLDPNTKEPTDDSCKNPHDSIFAGGTAGCGTALEVSAAVPVKIVNLKLTGGNKNGNGGGLYVSSGAKVILSDGAKITGNIANPTDAYNTDGYGGGLYVDSGASLFINGRALVGDSVDSDTVASDGANPSLANMAVSGGGIFCAGNLYIGYDLGPGGNPLEKPVAESAGYGIRRNYASQTGGGINFILGTCKIASGNISYNGAGGSSGGVHFGKGGEISGGTFEGNASTDGGAFMVTYGQTVTMTGGTIGGSTAKKQNTVSVTGIGMYNRGGAVCVIGNFSISGSAYIYPTTAVRTNDVYISEDATLKIAGSLTSTLGDKVATVTLENWKRGQTFLSSDSDLTDALVGKIALTIDDDGWERKIASDKKTASITSPIYVVAANDPNDVSTKTRPDGFERGVVSGATGTKKKPYPSIAAALGCEDLAATSNTITIAGTIGAQALSASDSIYGDATSITIAGYKPDTNPSAASIDAKGTADTSALKLEKSGITVTINNLTITGGSGTSMTVSGSAQVNGGGINLSAGTLKLAGGAVVKGNYAANYGGGVYVASGAELYMYGSALIGYDTTTNSVPTSAALGTSSGKAANYAQQGGGIYSSGSVYLGYTGKNNGSLVEATGTNKLSGGVRQNYASFGANGNGGGIYNDSGTFQMANGNISYNAATGYGGAIKGSGTLAGGTIEGNKAAKDGGGVYFNAGTLTVSGATFTKNSSTGGNGGAICNAALATIYLSGSSEIANNTAVDGGAIYAANTSYCYIKGAVSIPYGGAPSNNDVFLPSGVNLYVNGILSQDHVATITPGVWTRGNTVLQKSGTEITSIDSTIAGKFAVSDPDWNVVSHDSKGKINGAIYVSETKIVNNSAYFAGSDSASYIGTKKFPYKTISYATKKFWDTLDTKTVDFKIIVNGTLNGTQKVSATDEATVANAKSITVEGMADYSAYTGNSKLNANLSSPAENGSALIIDTAVPVTLNKLDITGGKTTGDGGGIRIDNDNSNVTITNTNIYSNYTTNASNAHGGGGIYLKKGILCLGENTIVHSNTAKYCGGGVLNYNGKVYICGGSKGAIIGYKDGINSRAQSSSTKANRAGLDASNGTQYDWGKGGGLYSASGNYVAVYLGYKPPETEGGDPVADTGFNGGFYYNWAKTSGGGLNYEGGYTGQEFKMSAGTIQYNVAGYGGGIHTSGTTTIEDCVIADNSADSGSGGGISSFGEITINKGTIGKTGVNNPAQNAAGKYSNYAESGGGGISASGVTIGSNVTISYNYAKTNGGGINVYGYYNSTIAGTISFNAAGGLGGGLVTGDGRSHYTELSGKFDTNTAAGEDGGGILYISGDRKLVLKSGFNVNPQNASVTKGSDDILVHYDYNYEYNGSETWTFNPNKHTYIEIAESLTKISSGKYIGLSLKRDVGDKYNSPNGVPIFDGTYKSQGRTKFKVADSGSHSISTGGIVK